MCPCFLIIELLFLFFVFNLLKASQLWVARVVAPLKSDKSATSSSHMCLREFVLWVPYDERLSLIGRRHANANLTKQFIERSSSRCVYDRVSLHRRCGMQYMNDAWFIKDNSRFTRLIIQHVQLSIKSATWFEAHSNYKVKALPQVAVVYKELA